MNDDDRRETRDQTHGVSGPGSARSGKRAPDDLERVRAALHGYATEFLLLVSTKGELIASSEYETLGYRGSERAGHHIAEHLHPDDLASVFDIIERARATAGFEETIRVRVRSADGSWGTFEATVIDATHNPDLQGAVLRVRDVTAEVERAAEPTNQPAEQPGGAEQDRFLSLAEALPLGILSADARGYVVFCNEAAQQILNLPVDHLLSHGWEKAVHHEDLPDVVSAAGQVLVTGIPAQVTFRVQTGLFPRWAHAKFVPLGKGTRRSGWIGTFEDVTDRRRAESRLAHQATHDPLTKLPNRMLLEDRLHQACGRLRRDSDSVTVLFVDLDDFKDVNDNFGHAAGDQVLIEVASRLLSVIRDIDTVARLGGDEFVIICENLPEGDEGTLVQRIGEAMAVPMLVERQQLLIGASVGVAFTRDPSLDSNELLALADQSMYRVKQSRHTG